jgi:hypothetical protein
VGTWEDERKEKGKLCFFWNQLEDQRHQLLNKFFSTKKKASNFDDEIRMKLFSWLGVSATQNWQRVFLLSFSKVNQSLNFMYTKRNLSKNGNPSKTPKNQNPN